MYGYSDADYEIERLRDKVKDLEKEIYWKEKEYNDLKDDNQRLERENDDLQDKINGLDEDLYYTNEEVKEFHGKLNEMEVKNGRFLETMKSFTLNFIRGKEEYTIFFEEFSTVGWWNVHKMGRFVPVKKFDNLIDAVNWVYGEEE